MGREGTEPDGSEYQIDDACDVATGSKQTSQVSYKQDHNQQTRDFEKLLNPDPVDALPELLGLEASPVEFQNKMLLL